MSEIRNLQRKEIEMISMLDTLFKENNIMYWLLGGSVLGSIRHQGFIPWDDDIDISIMRDEFDKAENLLSNLGDIYYYEKAECNTSHNFPIGHLYFIGDGCKLNNSPIVDVFAIDGVPKSRAKRIIQFLFVKVHSLCVCRIPYIDKGLLKKTLTNIFVNHMPTVIIDLLQAFSLKVITHWSCRTAPFIGNLHGAYGSKEIFKRSMFDRFTLGKFENLNLPLPADPDKYLKVIYGDYMKLPPIEDQVPKHRTFNQ